MGAGQLREALGKVGNREDGRSGGPAGRRPCHAVRSPGGWSRRSRGLS